MCVTLVIYRESSHDARLIKCKILKTSALNISFIHYSFIYWIFLSRFLSLFPPFIPTSKMNCCNLMCSFHRNNYDFDRILLNYHCNYTSSFTNNRSSKLTYICPSSQDGVFRPALQNGRSRGLAKLHMKLF